MTKMNETQFYHKDKNGNKTALCDLEIWHLKNIIRLIERKAKEGIIVRDGGGTCPDDFWYDEYELKGKEALNHMHHDLYVEELERRETEK